MDRRQFLAAAAAAGQLAAQSSKPALRFNAIQMSSQSLYDEGIDHVLDLIQDTAAINTIMPYSHMYHGGYGKAIQLFAPDHGVPPRDTRNRNLPLVWVKHHERYFKNTSLRHPAPDPSAEYANRDLFAELLPAVRKRGMKLYARILEGSGREAADHIVNYAKVETRDINGRPSTVPCWNHPEYRAWWTATVEDMFRSYELDGLQWGAERQGPFMNVIMPWNNNPPICFCEFCRARGRAQGIDPERARLGFEKLYQYAQGLMSGTAKPAEGVFAGFLGVLIRYPEILAWEYQYRLSREEMQAAIYNTVKSIKPEAQVGWHVDHQPSSWDIVYRAEMSYAEMAPYSDFIKFIAYHDILGPRIRFWYLPRLQRTVLSELSLKESLDLYYDIFGYDKTKEPGLSALATTGFSPDYVFRETKRSVASAEGKTKIYPGIGFDVPWGANTMPADPEKVYEVVKKAFEAGGAGIVVSREYEEMRLANLKAVGRAIRELS
ncbi:MAG TPA: hypothetical protein VML19_07315 [Verrucomicrobiae bacterium]|nr:hypothetical protein [Verrucomicrobiae bacterium]